MKNIDDPTTHDFLRLGLFVVQNLELLALQSIGVSKAEGNTDKVSMVDRMAAVEGNTENTTTVNTGKTVKTANDGKTAKDGKTPRPRVYQSLLNLHRVLLETYTAEEALQIHEEHDDAEKERYQNFLFFLVRIIKAAMDGYIFSHDETIVRCREELEKACTTLTESGRYATSVSSLSEATLLFFHTL